VALSAFVGLGLVLAVAIVLWRATLLPPEVVRGYVPRRGDVVFQRLPDSELARVIEGIGGSRWTHCGIVDVDGATWTVIEAVGPVRVVPLATWIRRGAGQAWIALRLEGATPDVVDAALASARTFLGRPYDLRFDLDDERIYCTELVHKAFAAALGHDLVETKALRDLPWQPHAAWIEQTEGGPPPLERRIVTPAALLASPRLIVVHDSTREAPPRTDAPGPHSAVRSRP
jgi:hypothetical protein